MYRYRQTPERLRKLDDLQRAWDTAHHEPFKLPAPGLSGMELQFHEEDQNIEQFGRLMLFIWAVKDEGGRSEIISGVATPTEAVVKTRGIWEKMDYKPRGRLTATRDDNTATPAPNQPYI